MRRRILLLACVPALLAPCASYAQDISQAARALDKRDKDLLVQTRDLQTSPTRVLVRFKNDATEADRANARKSAAATKLRSFRSVPGLEVWDTNVGAANAIAGLKKNPHVAYAEYDAVVRTDAMPNDHMFSYVWALNDGDGYAIHAPEAWSLFTGDPNFVIADIDTGMQTDNVDLAANLYTNPKEIPGNGIDDDHNGYVDDVHGWDFINNDNDPSDDVNHGTHTAGTMGAVGNNTIGIAGVNWQCKIMPLKFIGPNGGYTSDAVAAIDYAVKMGVKLSNNSWGSSTYEQSLYDAINAAKSAGHLFVAAAGNSGMNADNSPSYPAAFNLDNIISVAAVDKTGALASFSNYGPTSVDIAAPGVDVWSTVPGNQILSLSGTSMAAPHVAGVAALLWGYKPSMTWLDVKNRILQKAVKSYALNGTSVTGGLLDAYATLTDAPLPPIVSILAPGASGKLSQAQVMVAAKACDGQDGDVCQNIIWRDSVVGQIAQGPVCFTNSLSTGSHTLTATVTDSRGLTASSTITVNVCSPGPTVSGSPAAKANYPEGSLINLSATANDPTDGSLTSQIVWNSTLQGNLGQGSTFSRCDLAPGTHVLTARATDSGQVIGGVPWIVTILPATTVPTAPSNASWSKVTVNGISYIKISWSDNSSNETSFDVEVSSMLNRKSWSAGVIGYTATGGSTSVLINPSAGYTYRFRVRAKNSLGASAWSNYTTSLKI